MSAKSAVQHVAGGLGATLGGMIVAGGAGEPLRNFPGNISKGTGSNLSALAFSRDWSQAALCVFGEGVGIVFDRVTRADRAETRVIASLYCDIAWIQPGAFAVMSDAATA